MGLPQASGRLPTSKGNLCAPDRNAQRTGETARVEGVVVRGSAYAVAVRRGCDPLEPLALFGAALIAFPAPISRKLIGLAVGACLIFVANLVRIVSLYCVGRAQSPWFEAMHEEWWPALFVLGAGLTWLAWLAWARPQTGRAHA